VPNAEQIEKLKALCENILQPVRDHFGRVKITSGFRSVELCEAIGSSARSQHARAEAADFECIGVDNAELFDWIKSNLSPDQLILEFYTLIGSNQTFHQTSSSSSSTLQVNLTAGGSMQVGLKEHQEHHFYTPTDQKVKLNINRY
jgi:hypothetical protein